MPLTITLTKALRLLRASQPDTEAAELLQAAIDELERLYKVEAAYNESQQPAPDPADWAAANRMVER